jgi:hypothetical protein
MRYGRKSHNNKEVDAWKPEGKPLGNARHVHEIFFKSSLAGMKKPPTNGGSVGGHRSSIGKGIDRRSVKEAVPG